MSSNTKHSHLSIMAAAALLLVAISSCDEDALNIGQSLTDESDKLEVGTASFQVTTRTIMADSVLSLASDCYFGRVRDPETNADVTSEFTTQFHLLETTNVWPEDKFLSHYDGKIAADSCDIVLYLGSPFRAADSLVAMKMRVSEMATPLEEGHRYYSNFNPSKAGMLRTGGISKSQMFSYLSLTGHEEVNSNDDKVEVIRITLNDPYTAADGTTYKNYGTYLLRQYFDHPEYFKNAQKFIYNVCPGFYLKTESGIGSMANVKFTELNIFCHVKRNDSTIVHTIPISGTEEVLQMTKVENDNEAIKNLVSDNTCTYLKTPAGIFTEMTIPVEKIMANHVNDTLNTAKIILTRINNTVKNNNQMKTPTSVLMIHKDSIDSFFNSNKIPNNKDSYIATMTGNNYIFNNISNLIRLMFNQKMNGKASANWDKVVLIPVTTSTRTSNNTTTIIKVSHDMSLTSTKLVGGSENPHADLKLSVIYSKFSDQ